MCDWYDPVCKSKEFVASSIGDAITKTADAVLEAVGKTISSLGTMWVGIGTPNLTGGGGDSPVTPGDHAAGTEGINTLLGYITWIAFGLCVLSLIVAGVRMATGRRGEGQRHVDRLGIVLVATIIVSAATGIVTAIAPAVRSKGSPAVAFIQDSLWWYMIAIAIVGVIFGAGRMVWEQRAEPGKDLVKSLLTLVVVSGVGLTAVSLLTTAGDNFAVWILDGSLGCSVKDTSGTCFGSNMGKLLALTTNPTTGGLGSILVIVLGLLAVFASIVQILLMIVRAGMLVVLAGILPVSAAATNTDTGRQMFRKSVGWLLAFTLYKPAAAIVYATSFRLAGTNIFKDGGDGLISVVTGLTLMVVALVALPALMSLIVPAVSAVSGGNGMATAALAGAAMLPSGAIAAGRLMGGADGLAPAGPSGQSGPSGSGGGGGPSGGPGSSAAPAGSSTGGAGGAGAAGAAGSGGAGAAAAVSGPAGMAAAAGFQVVAGGMKAATGAVQTAAQTSSGDSNGII